MKGTGLGLYPSQDQELCGSGNYRVRKVVFVILLLFLVRMMLEMSTGLNTAIHMTEPHKDGGSLVTMSHHTDLDPGNKDIGKYLVDPPRR